MFKYNDVYSRGQFCCKIKSAKTCPDNLVTCCSGYVEQADKSCTSKYSNLSNLFMYR